MNLQIHVSERLSYTTNLACDMALYVRVYLSHYIKWFSST